jgi:putative membrane protein
MRRIVIIATVVGAIGFIALIARYGFDAVFGAMQTLGWGGFAAIVAFRLVVITTTGFAWSEQARRSEGRRAAFVWGRLIRDSAGEALPFSQLGGLVMGARAATLGGVSGVFAAASTIVDATIELAARVPYMILAALLLAWGGLGQQTTTMLAVTLGLTIAVALCVLLQGRGADVIAAIGARLVPQWLTERTGANGGILPTIRAIHARRGALIRAFITHFIGWTLSGLEVALPLWLMGKPVWIGAGIAIDCLIATMRSAAFMVPGGIGVQEGAYVVACGLFGIDPQVAIALSLLRRGRDIAIAIPSLLAWQVLEGRSALRGVGARGLISLLRTDG